VLQTFEPVEEMLMSQIPPSIEVIGASVMTVVAAIIVQRKFGSKRVLYVWLASAVIFTGYILTKGYILSPLSTRETLFMAMHLFIPLFLIFIMLFGMLVWTVIQIVPPPKHLSSTKINYFPYTLPIGKLEDTYGLAGILRRYHELLATFLTDLDTALASTLFNPYQSMYRDFLRSLQMYFPSYLRQARADSRQFKQVPNALMKDLAGADVVLAELETLTAAQLSAIEECHRVNVRRLRQRSIFRWSWPGGIAILGSALVSLGAAAEKVGGVKPSDFWPLIKGINLMGTDPQSFIILMAMSCLGIVALFFITNFIFFLPILRRVHAFEDILTIAKAYRKGLGETTKPSAEPSLTVTR
jgi:hypothetical protein